MPVRKSYGFSPAIPLVCTIFSEDKAALGNACAKILPLFARPVRKSYRFSPAIPLVCTIFVPRYRILTQA